MKRMVVVALLPMMASAVAFGDNCTMPDGTQFPMWEEPLHFTRTYCVDGQGKNADDNGPGTEDHPFKTINHVAQVLHPGSMIVRLLETRYFAAKARTCAGVTLASSCGTS